MRELNWFKKQINKIFIKDDMNEYEEYYEEIEEGMNHQEQQHSTKKSSFRFPLIADEEFTTKLEQNKSVDPKTEQHDQPFALPKYLQNQSTQVYDVEVSGIRELLERRQKGKGFTTVIRSRGMEIRQESAAKNKKIAKDFIGTEHTVKKEMINPLENRKRFVPTDVPSPVHGFRKVTPIEKLLPRKIEEHSGAAVERLVSAHGVEEVVATTAEMAYKLPNKEEMIERKEKIHHSNDLQESKEAEMSEEVSVGVTKPIGMNPVLNENNASEEIEEITSEQLSDMRVKHVTIENSTIHIGQLNVEQAQQNDFLQVNDEKETSDKGSRLPFNVLMLKSDKEKIKAKEMLQQQLHIKKQDGALGTTETEEYEGNSSDICNSSNTIAQNLVNILESDQKDNEFEKNEEIIEKIDLVLEQNNELNELKEEAPEHTIQINDNSAQNMINFEEKIVLTELEEISSEQRDDSFKHKEALFEQQEVLSQQNSQSSPFDQTDVVETSSSEQDSTPKYSRTYVKPPLAFLAPPEEKLEDWAWMDEQGDRLIEALSYFQVQAQIESIVQGPAVTQFEITVAHGTKVSKVRNLSDDIKLALAARDIRIDAPIPGKRSIGIEIPNRLSRAVRLSEVTNSDTFNDSDSPLEAALGLDLTGKPVTIDLRKMPHGLIAGATGSGKSVCINSILVSLLYKADPHELKLMLIDPKMVELAPFNHIPHLVSPVITDVKTATAALKWAVEEMERRYQLFMHAGTRDITRYNAMAESNGQYAQKLPYLLIVIDELADLMMMSPADVEEAICRIAQKARACGIHLILATQRPSVDVITGLIKSNIPTRIAFAVSSAVDSRTILDTQGAERLLGRGDMLYLGNGMPAATRIQGTFVTDDEIEEIIEHVRQQGEPDYIFQHDELLKKAEVIEEQDELFEEVCRFVYEQGTASTSSIQRRYHIGYNRAARLVDMLEKHGFVSEQRGSKPREVFITDSDIMSMFES